MCDKCRRTSDGGDNSMPQLDAKRRGVCTVCANNKREVRQPWNKRLKVSYEQKHGVMWKQLSVTVRDDIEIQFRMLRDW